MRLNRNPVTVTVEQDGDHQVVVSEVVVDEAPNAPATIRLASHLDPAQPLNLTHIAAPKTAAERIAAVRAQIERDHAELIERTLRFIEQHGFERYAEIASISNPFHQRAAIAEAEATA